MTIRFRRVPGYYNRSTYHVDVDGQHRLTVVRVSDRKTEAAAVADANEHALTHLAES